MSREISPQETVERALSLSRADGCIVVATERTEANLRWASNSLTTNGEMSSRRLAVVSTVNGQTGTAVGVVERSAVSADALEGLVRASEQAARDAGPAEDATPLVEPTANHPGSAGWDDVPASTSIGVFADVAPALGSAFGRAEAEKRLLYGFAEQIVDTTYVGTSSGLRLRHVQPTGRVEVNGKSADLSRSAWTGRQTRDMSDVDIVAIDQELATRLGWAERTVDLQPGRYETILPPSCVGDLMIYLYWTASARDADEGTTVFAKQGGGSRIGERLAELPLSLYSDPAYPGMECAPFVMTTASGSQQSVFDTGLPVSRTDWIHDGVLAALMRPRWWAERTGVQAFGPIDNLVLEGAPGAPAPSIEDMVARTERGLLLTTLWYIREVDPQTLLVTGLTRDGVYLVEGGEVTAAVNNFRFNDSPVGMLGRVTEVGRTEMALPREWSDWFTRTAMPALRVPDFNMSSVSQAS